MMRVRIRLMRGAIEGDVVKLGIGGFYLVECVSREEALELAGKVPPSSGAAVEVRPIVEF